MGLGGVVASRYIFGTSQPEPRVWRRKQIEDGPKGAASRVASKAEVVPPTVDGIKITISKIYLLLELLYANGHSWYLDRFG